MRVLSRRSSLKGESGRSLTVVLALLLAGSLHVVPAFAGSASPGDTVIDSFTAGSGSWSACGNSTFAYFQNPSIIGGARELSMRDAGSCHYGPYPARMSIDATQGTAQWYGYRTYSPEQTFSYGTEIGTHDVPWSLSPNKSKATPLNLHLSLSDEVRIQMVQISNSFLGIRIRDRDGNTYIQGFTLAVGSNLFPLSSFPGLSAAAAANIDGISFWGGANTTPGDVVSLFAIRSGDSTPPTAAPRQTPTANSNGWNNSDVTVNWNWTDAGSGIDPNNCTQLSTSSGEGTITLTTNCQDLGGNVASASYSIKVDKTPPTVIFAGGAGAYTVAQSVAITCTSSDVLSGVNSALSNCPSASGPAWSFGLGTTTLNAKVFDNADNVTTTSKSFTVTVDEASLCSLVKEFSTNGGIANGLCAKLEAAAAAKARGQFMTQANVLKAFENQVTAQSGKALTPDQATRLAAFANSL